MKMVKRVGQGKIAEINPVFGYLASLATFKDLRCKATEANHFLDLDVIEEALRVRLCYQLASILAARKKSTATKTDFVNSEMALEIVKVAQEHIKYISFILFGCKIKPSPAFNLVPLQCPKNKENMSNLCMLYGLCQLNEDAHGCYESGYFQAGVPYGELILEAIKTVNLRLRPQAIAIVEALPMPDAVSVSAVGNSYGDIYETHLEWAKNSRLNKTKAGDAIPDGYMEYMMPLLKGKM